MRADQGPAGPAGPGDATVLAWFDFHPATPTTGPIHDEVRQRFRLTATFLLDTLPPSADRTLAVRKLQEAMWAANSCIANAPPASPDPPADVS